MVVSSWCSFKLNSVSLFILSLVGVDYHYRVVEANGPLIEENAVLRTVMYEKSIYCDEDDQTTFDHIINNAASLRETYKTVSRITRSPKSIENIVEIRIEGRHPLDTDDPGCRIRHTWLNHLDVGLVQVKGCEQFSEINGENLKVLLKEDECVSVVEDDIQYDIEDVKDLKGFTPDFYAYEKVQVYLNRNGNSKTTPLFTPSDEFFSEQWEHNNVHGVKTQLAWDITTGGNGTIEEQPKNTIGVIDASFWFNHADLRNKWYRNTKEICDNGIDDDENGLIDDCYGWNFTTNTNDLYRKTWHKRHEAAHGTAVSGVIAAEANNGLGLVGACPGCRVLPATTSFWASELLKSTNYFKSQGVKIINISFGGVRSKMLYHVIENNPDILFVTSAGNKSCDLNSKHECIKKGHPATESALYPNLIAVGAINPNGERSGYSNYGIQSVHVFAPGQILGLYNEGETPGYKQVRGTSFAAPLVAGIAGMMMYENPKLSPVQVRDLIMATSQIKAYLIGFCVTGGVVDAQAAVRAARRLRLDEIKFEGGGAAAA